MSALDPFDGLTVLGEGESDSDDHHGTTSSVELAKSAYVVMVHVVDLETGAFRHYQQLVVSSPFSKRQEPTMTLPDPPRQMIQVNAPDEPVA